MIQRIQSVYMVLTTLLSLLFLKGSFLTFINDSGALFMISFGGLYQNTGIKDIELMEKLLPLSSLFIITPVLSLITIAFFKNRKIQMICSGILILLIILLVIVAVYYSYNIVVDYKTHITIGYKMFLPIFLLLFTILAYRGIKKDDLLVKSYDRLR